MHFFFQREWGEGEVNLNLAFLSVFPPVMLCHAGVMERIQSLLRRCMSTKREETGYWPFLLPLCNFCRYRLMPKQLPGKTKSENEKRCSYNLQSGHPAWWKADNCSIFLTVNIFSRKKRTDRGNQKWLKNWKKIILGIFVLNLSFGTEIAGENKTQPC